MDQESLRERNGCKLSALQPMNSSRINGHSFFGRDVRTILEISMLAFLLRLEVETYILLRKRRGEEF